MFYGIGPLTGHMAIHILLMNAVAPLIALAASGLFAEEARLRPLLFTAMTAQLAVLWAWHTPPALDAALRSRMLHLAMQASLLLCAVWFWSAVFHIRDDRRWRPILALLVTSKLFCLLGVLLVFAPRSLYPALAAGQAHGGMHSTASVLGDQQFAGLLMLVACPATYVLAGIVIAARWFRGIEAAEPASFHPSGARHGS